MLVAALAAAGVATAVPSEKAADSARVGGSKELRNAVEPAGILVHERRLQRIANANDGTRSSGTPGYKASADYVAGKLERAGYRVKRQTFEFPFFQEISSSFSQTEPDQRDFEPYDISTNTGDYAVMTYSGSGVVEDVAVVPTNDVQIPPPAEPGSTSGCEASDFPAEVSGNVALIQRGTCTFQQKAQNAEAAGAVAAIIFNEGQEGRTDVVLGTLGEPGIGIPVLGVSFALGQDLFKASGPRVSMDIQTASENRATQNIIADTRTGRADRTVVVGAHLDSVLEGPGINDNGSGSATILETALQMDKLNFEPRNRVRFAFWGAEEFGLLGSDYYVNNISDRKLDNIALNLNFDMLGSPNYVRFVYDGDGSDTELKGPAGSAQIEDVFNNYFTSRGLETDPTAFDGRSDYGPFIEQGIPAGGLFSGAEGVKTPEQEDIYGGTSGVAYDECYHQACDDISNLSIESLDEMSDAVAHATRTYAKQKNLFVSSDDRLGARSSGKVYDKFKGPEARK